MKPAKDVPTGPRLVPSSSQEIKIHRVQHGWQLPISQVEMISFHDDRKGLQLPGAVGCGRTQAFLACLPNV